MWRIIMNVMTQAQSQFASPFKTRYDNFIGGRFVPPVNGTYFENITPITGAVVCEVARSGAADVVYRVANHGKPGVSVGTGLEKLACRVDR